jgi:hypothetical protein
MKLKESRNFGLTLSSLVRQAEPPYEGVASVNDVFVKFGRVYV